MKNLIEDVLETVKFKSAVYFKHGFCGVWGMEGEQSKYAQFHFVAGGNCLLQIGEERHELSQGDLVIFPTGHHHYIKAYEGVACQSGSLVVEEIINGHDPFSEGQVNTHLICGHYELDREISHFLLADLPAYILIKNEEYGRFDLITTVLNFIIDEFSAKQLGYSIISLKFAEILFISILRHYYLHQTENSINLFKDEAIYQSVNYIHNNLNDELSIEKLSRHSGISRTLFIERFKSSVGNTPLGYIKTWRMTKAKQLLKYTDLSLGEISEQVGYGSPSAFNRVFKQTFDLSPKKFRTLALMN